MYLVLAAFFVWVTYRAIKATSMEYLLSPQTMLLLASFQYLFLNLLQCSTEGTFFFFPNQVSAFFILKF